MERSFVPKTDGVNLADHTADIWLEVEGADINECIQRALQGLYTVMSQEFILHEEMGSSEEFENGDPEMLLVDVLSEALFLFDSESSLIIDPKLVIEEDGNNKRVRLNFLKTKCTIPSNKGGMEVKAVTFHGAEFREVNEKWKGRVLLDL